MNLSNLNIKAKIKNFLQKYRHIIIIFFILKTLLFLLAVTVYELIPVANNSVYHNIDIEGPQIEKNFSRFDGQWYLDIARDGYKISLKKYTLRIYAFFPLYPALIKIFSLFLFGNLLLSGILISFIFSFLSCILFYKLITLDEEANVAKKSITYLLIYPAAIFFMAIYTEALFLFLVLGVFYYSRKRQWLIAGIFGYFACLTRANGIILTIPILVEYYFYIKENGFNKSAILNLISLTLIPLGLISYFSYSYHMTGDFFTPMNVQHYWLRKPLNLLNIPGTLFESLKNFNTLPLHKYEGSKLETIMTFTFLLLIPLMYQEKMRPSYIIYALLIIFFPLSSGLTSSMTRYLLVSFPHFILLGKYGAKSENVNIFVTVIFALFLSAATIRYINWYWTG
jgi:hypothetical protein